MSSSNAASITRADQSMPVHSKDRDGQRRPELPTGKATPAKAALNSPAQSISLCVITKEALLEHGKLENAARDLEKDPSQFSRELRKGGTRLSDLDNLDPDAKALWAKRVYEQWGTPTDPKELIRRELREARTRLNRIEEILGGEATR